MPKTVWIAFSGGLDSHVLLHFLNVHFPQLLLKAIHINHQLLPDALVWEKHCRRTCRNLKIPLKIMRVTITRHPGESLEAKAREARYSAFKKNLKKNDILLTAHHQDDQAETLLLQLLRGAGLRGASAMPQVCVLGKGFLGRPLLSFSRKILERYAQVYQLQWVEDPSNQYERFDRNYLRHTVFPLLKKRWPHCHRTLARFSQHCAAQEKLLRLLAEKDAVICRGDYLNALSISALTALEKSQQKNLLRYFIEKLHFPLPPEKIINEIINLCRAAEDKNPVVRWLDLECRRFKGNLFMLSPLKPRQSELTPAETAWCQTHLPFFNPTQYQIRYRKGGETFKPAGSLYTRTLKNLFQEWHIPPWLRDHIPLIYQGKKLIAIVGYAIC